MTAMSGPELQIPINQALDELQQQVDRIEGQINKAKISMEEIIFDRTGLSVS